MDSLRIRYADPTLRLTTLDNVVAAAWFNAPEVAHMRAIDQLTESMRREHAPGFAYVNLVVTGVPKFTKEVLDEIQRMDAKVSEKDLAVAHIVLVDGLVGTAVRSFLSTVILLTRPREPTKVLGDIPSSAKWLLPFLARAGGYDWTENRLLAYLTLAIEP